MRHLEVVALVGVAEGTVGDEFRQRRGMWRFRRGLPSRAASHKSVRMLSSEQYARRCEERRRTRGQP